MPPKKTLKRKRYPSIVQSTAHLPLSTGMKKLIFSNLFSAGNVLRVQLAFESVRQIKLPVRLLFQFCSCVIISSSNPYPVHNFVPMVLTLFPYVNINYVSHVSLPLFVASLRSCGCSLVFLSLRYTSDHSCCCRRLCLRHGLESRVRQTSDCITSSRVPFTCHPMFIVLKRRRFRLIYN